MLKARKVEVYFKGQLVQRWERSKDNEITDLELKVDGVKILHLQ